MLFAAVLLFGVRGSAADTAQAGDQVVEFTDDTRIHGRVLKFGTDELFLQRTGFKEPLVFSLREIRRIVLRGPLAKADIRDSKTNATLQFHGGGWIAGDLSTFADGRFQVRIGKLADVAIDREKVRWLFLSPSNSPDACDGPGDAMGLAGWEGGGAWETTDAGLVARGQPMPLRRVLDLPARVDIEFSGGDNAQGNAAPIGFVLGESDDNRDDNITGGFIQVMLQSNHVSASSLAAQGLPFKNFQAPIAVDKNAPKPTRFRILHDRRTGRIVVLVNGKKIADWDGQWKKNAARTCKIVLQPNVGPGTPWPQRNMRISPWDGDIEPDAKPGEAGKDLLSTDAPGRSAGSLDAVTADTVRFRGKDFPRKEPLFIRLAGNNAAEPQPRAIARLCLVQRGEFDATALDFRDGHIQVRTSFGGEFALPVVAVRSIEFPHSRATAEAEAAVDRLVFKNGDVLRGTLVAAKTTGAVGWRR